VPSTFRHLDTITSAFVAVLLISNVAALKVFVLGGLTFDGGALIFPVSYIFGDILTEVYGYKVCRRVIWTGFAWLLIYNLVLGACMVLPPEPGWNEGGRQHAFEQIFGLSPRLVLAGIVGFFWGEFSNAYVLARMKIWTKGKHLWSRTIGSTLVGELVDTALFCTIAFAGFMSTKTIINYTVTGYVYKSLIEILMTPVTYKVVHWLKSSEGVDAFDTDTNFNPFTGT
jgi:uncharacterized integral membrane protein (TIGR00697 family)